MNNLIATVAVEKTFFSTDSDFDYIIPVSLTLKSAVWLKYLSATAISLGAQ